VAKKKKSAAKRPAKRAAAKRPAKRAVKRSAKKSSRSAKRPAKKSAKRSSKTVDVSKLVIPPVPTRGSSSFSSASVAKPAAAAQVSKTAPKKNSSGVFFLVIAGVVLLALFALSNASNDDDTTAKPTPSASVSDEASEEPTAEPSESADEETGNLVYEAPSKFVAINNASGGVTLRWKAPIATEGLTGYLVSISYNAVDFKEVATVPADQLNLDVARVGDEGGTQFFIQSVYSDGKKADGAKFALKGKYE
jgi:hypothetical protein